MNQTELQKSQFELVAQCSRLQAKIVPFMAATSLLQESLRLNELLLAHTTEQQKLIKQLEDERKTFGSVDPAIPQQA